LPTRLGLHRRIECGLFLDRWRGRGNTLGACKLANGSITTGDKSRAGPKPCAGAWRKLGFGDIPSSRPKGALYLESLLVCTLGLARVPNYVRLIRELRLLKRRTHRSGKDTVEHPRNGHDDHANVVCGVFSLLAPPPFEEPNKLTSPIIVSGGPITHLWGGRSGIIEL